MHVCVCVRADTHTHQFFVFFFHTHQFCAFLSPSKNVIRPRTSDVQFNCSLIDSTRYLLSTCHASRAVQMPGAHL